MGNTGVPPAGQGGPIGGSLQDLVTVQGNGVRYLGLLVQFLKQIFPQINGSFTMTATATLAVADTRVQANSIISLTPTNAAAGTLQGSAKALYISSVTAGVGFTVATASGGNAVGTETFKYYGTTPV
jgi:hypothetical protein